LADSRVKTRKDKALARWRAAMPGTKALPFRIDRTKLYRVGELYRGYRPRTPESWTRTFDHAVYCWTLGADGKARKLGAADTVAERLHDTAIGRATEDFLKMCGRKVVGIMGGHDTPRNAPEYHKVADIARRLQRRGFTIVTGGGPGLMEAANFGAFMACYSDKAFARALAMLGEHPSATDHAAWIASAAQIRAGLLGTWNGREKRGSWSLGIPTWYYGNEPPNLFASHSGKYFFNSVREDGLITIADGGIVFGPGKAGTVQEIFQNAPLNYYRTAEAATTPMVLLGVEFWNPKTQGGVDHKPAWPLLQALARQADLPFDDAILLSDDCDAIVALIAKGGARRRAPKAADAVREGKLRGRAMASF
jgi:predicted Rossmann-fold nucleotide-binding protein